MPQPIRRPRRTLAALATGLAAVGVAIGSGADFTAHSENPGSEFIAGRLSIDNMFEGNGLNAASLVPGAPRTRAGTEIGNTGDVPAELSLSRTDVENHDAGADAPGPVAGKLNLTVYDCGAPEQGCDVHEEAVYDGTLESMSDPVPLGRFAPGQYHYYSFAVGLDGSAGDAYQGDWASTDFVWDAVPAGR
jgi:hypothetical protein